MAMKIFFLIVCVVFMATGVWLYLINKPPKNNYRIWEGFHWCSKCGSLDGGIYGKGPHKAFRTVKATYCIHKWQSIDKTAFMKKAKQDFLVQWGKEAFYWQK